LFVAGNSIIADRYGRDGFAERGIEHRRRHR
jgi:hypothetical protein